MPPSLDPSHAEHGIGVSACSRVFAFQPASDLVSSLDFFLGITGNSDSKAFTMLG